MSLYTILRKLLVNDINLIILSLFLNRKYLKNKKRIKGSKIISAKEWGEFAYKVNKILINIHPRFYLASDVAKGVFFPINEMPFPSDLSLLHKELNILNSLASCGSNLFSFIGFGKFLSWFARWASIVAKVDMELPVREKKADTIIEFGSGLGLDPIYLSLLNKNSKVKLYDLPSMIRMQKNVHRYWNNEGFAIDTSKFEYHSDFDNFKDSINSNGIIDFYAFWSFSESPLELRYKFHDLFKSFNRIIIVSNEEMFGIDNLKYFEDLKNILKNSHNYTSLTIPSNSNKESYMSKHSIKCFYK